MDAGTLLTGNTDIIRFRLIVRLLMEIAGLIRDLAERAKAKSRSKKASRARAAMPAIEAEIEALMEELRALEVPKRHRRSSTPGKARR